MYWAQGLGSLHLGFHLQQQLFHLARPGLLEFFLNKGQLPQMMHIAPRLNEAVALIAQQAIMDARATKRRSNANGIECQDRKSTRLNSSHANISYAVFCLKKKTTNNRK